MPYTDPYLAFSENFIRSNLMMRQLEYAREMQRRQEERYSAQLAEVIRHNKVREQLLADQYAAKRTTDFSAATDWTPVDQMIEKHLDAVGKKRWGPNFPEEAVLSAWNNFYGEFSKTLEGQNMSPNAQEMLRTHFSDYVGQLNAKTNRFRQWLGTGQGEYRQPESLPFPGEAPAFPATGAPAVQPEPPVESPAAFRNPPPTTPGKRSFMDIVFPDIKRRVKAGESKPTGQLLEKNGRKWRVVGYDTDGEPLVVPA